MLFTLLLLTIAPSCRPFSHVPPNPPFSFDSMLVHGSPLRSDGKVEVDSSLVSPSPSSPSSKSSSSPAHRTRTVSITPNLSFNLRESPLLTSSVQSYISSTHSSPDPFGLAMWPGAVLSSRLLLSSNATNCLILGCGSGLEGMAALSAGMSVHGTDYNPSVLPLFSSNCPSSTSSVFDITSRHPLPLPPGCDLLVASDVLYNDVLAVHLGRRVCEAGEAGVGVIVTDSQRFNGKAFIDELNKRLKEVGLLPGGRAVAWRRTKLKEITTCSMIEEGDVTYDVDVDYLTF